MSGDAAVVCPVCGLRIGHRAESGLIVVDRRDAPLVEVVAGTVRCRAKGCPGAIVVGTPPPPTGSALLVSTR